ncbi:helix-turn-helix domain-containing protein [bacterium]|nr:helix-turn-helix domain-containing protein [bacterium]MBU1752552.1 helix-turn-helix domain-containing protein [bacterium]
MEIQERAVYTTDETAQILKISTVTVERKIRRGEIPATKIGRKYRLLGNDILGLFDWKNKERKKEEIVFGSYNIGVADNMSRKEMYSDR